MSEFKRFFISIAIILSGCIIVDVVAGKIGDKLLTDMPPATTILPYAKYCMHQVDADVVIIGASRANHHYVSSMITDSLNLSVYNAGQDGCEFGYNSCILNGILQHSTPKVVIFDVAEGFIAGKYNDRVLRLSPYYGLDSYITTAINDVDKYAPIKLSSNMYRYNNKLPEILCAYITSINTDNGYRPLIPNHNESLQKSITNNIPICNQTAYRFFMNIVNWSKQYGYQLIVIDSPRFLVNKNNYSIIRPICEQNNIICIDNSNIPYFMNHPELFNDISHLNQNGAEIYTQMFIKQIKPLITDPCQEGRLIGNR